jgi:acyl carrier protein
MIPSNFIILETLPYLASGKVDRKTLGLLPEPENLRPELASSYVAPRTQVEKEIASVWSEVLGVSQIGIYDNFFELGGHSLLATQIISRLREIYNVEIPLRRLFESPTIETFATAIAQSLVEQEFVQSGKESIEELLNELEGLSDDEIKRLLESEDND